MKKVKAVIYASAVRPGLVVLQFPYVQPPFGFAWEPATTRITNLYERPLIGEACAEIKQAIAEYNGDYDGKIPVSLEQYIYDKLFPKEV